MEILSRRKTALDMAMTWNTMHGIDCPGCLFKMAENFDKFLENGAVEVGHLVEADDDDTPDNVIEFDPKGRPN